MTHSRPAHASPLIPSALTLTLTLLALTPLPAQAIPQFRDITTTSNITLTHTDLIDTMAGGVCFFDYDNDGYSDLFVSSRGGGTNRLYRNNRNATFTDVSSTSGLAVQRYTMGAYAADVDNDGWQDLVVLTHGAVLLYRNNRNATFTDVSVGSGLLNPYWATAATFGDYDRDGLVDLYIGNYVDDGFFPYFQGAPNKLFRNEGNYRFKDVTATAGVNGFGPYRDPRGGLTTYATTLSTLFFDYDSDGWPDLFVGNDFGVWIIPNLLYRNNGDGTFTDVSASANFAIPEFNMGLATADVNGDQKIDLYTANLGDNHLMFNDGNGRFRDLAGAWGAKEGTSNGLLLTSWAIMFMDVDLDRRPDLYVSNGFIKTVKEMDNDPLAPKHLLYNIGTSYVVMPPPLFPLDQGVGRGAARADIDGDGDEDIVQLNNRQPIRVYRNDTPRVHQTVIIDLLGTLSNRDGIGAHVTLRTPEATQVREHNRGGSYMSCDASSIVMGLRNEREVEELRIKWPSGVVSRRIGLAGDRRHLVVEPSVTVVSAGKAVAAGPDWIEIPVTVENHAQTGEPVSLNTGVSIGPIRIPFPSYSAPTTVGARSRVTVPVYLPLPHAAIPIAQTLGVWLQVNAVSRTFAMDQAEAPIR